MQENNLTPKLDKYGAPVRGLFAATGSTVYPKLDGNKVGKDGKEESGQYDVKIAIEPSKENLEVILNSMLYDANENISKAKSLRKGNNPLSPSLKNKLPLCESIKEAIENDRPSTFEELDDLLASLGIGSNNRGVMPGARFIEKSEGAKTREVRIACATGKVVLSTKTDYYKSILVLGKPKQMTDEPRPAKLLHLVDGQRTLLELSKANRMYQPTAAEIRLTAFANIYVNNVAKGVKFEIQLQEGSAFLPITILQEVKPYTPTVVAAEIEEEEYVMPAPIDQESQDENEDDIPF